MLHALRVLRCHGMNDAALKTVYHAVVISRLMYASTPAVLAGCVWVAGKTVWSPCYTRPYLRALEVRHMTKRYTNPRLLYFTLLYFTQQPINRQRIDAFIWLVIRAGFCDKNIPAVSDLVEDADGALFERAVRDKHHVLYYLFPDCKTNLNTIWDQVVMSLFESKSWTPVRLQFYYSITLQRLLMTLRDCSLGIVQLYNCVIARVPVRYSHGPNPNPNPWL